MKKRGRPVGDVSRAKTESIEIRVTKAEKDAFREAADIAGIGLSTWMRERLRRAAVRELEDNGRIAGFLPQGKA